MRRKSCVCGSRIAGRHTPLAPRSIRNTQSRQKNDSSSRLPVDTRPAWRGVRLEGCGRSKETAGLKVTPRKRLRQTPTGATRSEAPQLRLLITLSAAFPSCPPTPWPLPSACWATPLRTGTEPTPRPPRGAGAVAPAAPSWAPGSFVRDDEPHANHETLAAHQQPEEKTRVTKRRPK